MSHLLATEEDVIRFVETVAEEGIFALDTETTSKQAWSCELELVTMHSGKQSIALEPSETTHFTVAELLKMKGIKCIMWNGYYDCTVLHRHILPWDKWKVDIRDGMVLSWMADNRGAGNAIQAVHGLKEVAGKVLKVKMKTFYETHEGHPDYIEIQRLRKLAFHLTDSKKLITYYNKIDNARRRRMRERKKLQADIWKKADAEGKAQAAAGALDKKVFQEEKKQRAQLKKDLEQEYREYHVDIEVFDRYRRTQLKVWSARIEELNITLKNDGIAYALDDAKQTYRLYHRLFDQIAERTEFRGPLVAWSHIEHSVRQTFIDAHIRGVKLNRPVFLKLAEEEIRPTYEKMEREVHELLWKDAPHTDGYQFGLNKARDISDILFHHLKLRPISPAGKAMPITETKPSVKRCIKLIEHYEEEKAAYDVAMDEYPAALEEYDEAVEVWHDDCLPLVTADAATALQALPLPPVKPLTPLLATHVPEYSTKATVLRFIDHPIVEKITSYRSMKLMYTTFAVKLGGRAGNILHGLQNTTGADTGRFTSKNPNLQNIPSRSAVGVAMRNGFISRLGKLFVVADFSQIELRLVAAIAGVLNMIDEYNKYELDEYGMKRYLADIHTRTATDIGMDRDKIAKNANFLMTYMGGAKLFHMITGVSLELAQQVHERFNTTYREISAFGYTLKNEWDDGCRTFLLPLSGRTRVWDKQFYNPETKRFETARISPGNLVNTYVQGSGADLLKLVIYFLNRFVLSQPPFKGNTFFLMQIHDEIVIETNEENAEDLAFLVKAFMEYPYWDLPLPIEAGVKFGDRWGIAKDKKHPDVIWTPERREFASKWMPFDGRPIFNWRSSTNDLMPGPTSYGASFGLVNPIEEEVRCE